ncbi:hypothetical protein ASC64_03000 [Nocardioides sp. Root122]|uniref:divisome protein SepX/GlpR n=1 Tax=Nocardioides TaxID=1839 RepID=UPI0007031D46|nr:MULTISPECIES: hypothetical protein [Nocardioides]KQV77800.1 hypothetical protein ASC64_03000 [Nocardioides sp. Root122]MCK9822279.1 hypothetical protein [Nocardioides cavernae]
MDLSALIFVALAVAWAVYLIPKALKHHDEVVRSRSVEKFSHTMRVLARREPVDRRNARLVVAPIRAALRPPVETKAHVAPGQVDPVAPVVPAAAARAPQPPAPDVQRAAARRAARRRRNVLAVIVLANAVVVGLAAASVVAWPRVAAPVAVLLAWLVACRVSVRAEHRQRAAWSAIEIGDVPEVEPDLDDVDLTGEVPVVAPAPPLPRTVEDVPAAEAPAVTTGEVPVVVGGWEMVPTTLPTYVSKPAAQRRTVSTIDLDSTGVWSSGHNDEDSALARSAEQSARTAREAEEGRRASGA